MLASLYLLSTATEKFAAREALANASFDEIGLTVQVKVDGPVAEIRDAALGGISEVLGAVPYSTALRASTSELEIPRGDRGIGLAYFAYLDGVAEHIELVDGRLANELPGPNVEAAIPEIMATQESLQVGDTFEIFPYGSFDELFTVEVVGIYRVLDPSAPLWRDDALDAAGYNPETPFPFSGGRILTDGYGPLLTAWDEMSSVGIGSLALDITPDYSATSLAEISSLVSRLDGAENAVRRAIGTNADTVALTTNSQETLGRVLGSLAVTRSSVLVTGLLLLVLGVAALGQAARLMSERRHVEQHLMRARGSSNRQLISLALIEAVMLAAITTVVAPLLANQTYGFISRQSAMVRAGMDRDPGFPPLIWATTAAVGLVLVLVLVIPLLRRGGTFVEASQSRSRPGRRAAFQRSGLDVALLVLAALAYWQLRSYRSPVLTGGGVARLDPLLAAGPALALLAGALVSVRLIPAASKITEAIAARGRRAVTPLAAWEVGRRSARAVSAILLLTLAVAVGTFSMSFLATWKGSQNDQAQFLHPSNLTVSELGVGPLAQADIVTRGETGATAAPYLITDASISTTLQNSNRGNGIDGRPVRIQATTNAGLAAYDSGRLADEGGGAIAAALSRVSPAATGAIELPAGSSGVQFTLRLSSSETALPGLRTSLNLVVRDSAGTIATVPAGVYDIDGTEHLVRAVFADSSTVDHLAAPLSVIGLQTTWFSTEVADAPRAEIAEEGDLLLVLSIDNLAALTPVLEVPVPGVGSVYDATLIDVPEDGTWFATFSGVDPTSLSPEGDQIHMGLTVNPSGFLRRPLVPVTLSTQPIVSELRVVANDALMTKLGSKVGTKAVIELNGSVITIVFADTVPLMPGESPRTPTILTNLDDLQLALVQNGAAATDVTEWWVDVPAETREAYLAGLPADATMSTQAETARSLQEDPLRVAIQAGLWLVAAAAIVLAALGFAVHAVVTVRSREVEFAQLRAVGLQQSALTRLVGAESLLLAFLGGTFGIGIGVALSYLVAPLVSVGPDGRPPVPGVLVEIPWDSVGLLAAEVALVLAVAVLLVSLLLRRIDPARMLRSED